MLSRDAGKTKGVCLHLFSRIARILCRETFINRILLRNVNVHAQLPVGRERGREQTKETERCGYERRAFVAHQHSKYSVEGGRGSSEQKRNKNLPREQDVALIFIREKRGCCAEEREDEVGEGRSKWNANALTSHWGTTGAHPSLGHECTLPLINTCVIIRYGWSPSSSAHVHVNSFVFYRRVFSKIRGSQYSINFGSSIREHARRLVTRMASRVMALHTYVPSFCRMRNTMRENDRRWLYIKVTTKKALLAPKYATRSSLRGETNPTNLQCASTMWMVDNIAARDKLYSIIN